VQSGGAPANQLEAAEKNDPILQVSLALDPLTRATDPQTQWAVAGALRHWGTEKNVAGLLRLADLKSSAGDKLPREAFAALRKIKDNEGIPKEYEDAYRTLSKRLGGASGPAPAAED
jgi:hypothetical protein